MERALYSDLLRWKTSKRRKPLLLRGARQTGKTYLLRQFGEREYEKVVYFDFERDPSLASFFDRNLEPKRIVSELELYSGQKIRPETDLIVFDEIQASNRALASLKYFSEQAPEYHVAGAGSLLGISLSGRATFPVGKVNFLDLSPMSFVEYLVAMRREEYASLLEGMTRIEPIPDGIHRDLIEILQTYFFVGGMPEAVGFFADSRDVVETRRIHSEILDSYTLDFAKHAPTADIPKLRMIWDSVPRHLARENRKFMFSAVRKGARAREFENALRWLVDSGLVRLCHAVTSNRQPLKHYADRSVFKVYPLDIGLLGAMSGASARLTVESETIFTEYRGALTESYVAQQLCSVSLGDLYYWRSSGGKAELDFVIETGGAVFPVEVKAGLSRHSKSLSSFDHQFDPDAMVRTNLRNLKYDGKTLNLSLYSISVVSQFLSIVSGQ